MASTRTILAAALAAFAAAAPASAQSGWGMIGESEVGTQAGSGAITPRGADPFRQFMICVDLAPLRFRTITVRFAGGASQAIAFRDRIAAGACGRALSVRGRAGPVASIDVAYEPGRTGNVTAETARVQIFGR
ncbi:MAG TPA: hypothetical protein VEX35_11120 [Allosphingosinicella sp.]|nr:hypothetical protein [Allosphingosinicella sp.]